jgi:hypothetical protein
MNNALFYLPIQRELKVFCSKNIIRNFIPVVKMFWLSGQQIRLSRTSDQFQGKKLKEIPLLINFENTIFFMYMIETCAFF